MIDTFSGAYKDKVVLVTGHTGFKGSWLSIWLTALGARVVGYALDPTSPRGNYQASHLKERLLADERGDICDSARFEEVVSRYKPSIIFHLAAQALVRTSYQFPKATYQTNVMGSLHILEAARKFDFVKQIIMITSDKCYENVEQTRGYCETDRMGGYDPYSSSKGCMELLIASWRNSFFNPKEYVKHGKALASVRSGNAIGGGDWGEYRLVPDCIRFLEADQAIEIRSPQSTRPWMHVLEPLSGYLKVGEKLQQDPATYSTCFNFGPGLDANHTVREVAEKVISCYGKGSLIIKEQPGAVHENKLLNLDATKAYRMLDNWQTRWSFEQAIQCTVDWYKEALRQKDMWNYCLQQIETHEKGNR